MNLRHYQFDGLKKWAKLGFRGALYWKPGLGKTFTAIFAIKRLIDTDKTNRVLVLCPSGLTYMWEEELIKNGIEKNFIFRYKPKHLIKKDELEYPTENKKIIIISYSLFIRRDLKLNFDCYICDESHVFKSHKSEVYKKLIKIVKPNDKVLLMSATPFPQGRHEVFSQINLIKPGILGKNITQFRETFCQLINKEYFEYKVRDDKADIIDKVIHKICDLQTDSLLEIPPTTTIEIPYELTDRQYCELKRLKKSKTLLTNKLYKYEIGGEKTQIENTYIPIDSPSIRLLLYRQISSGFEKVSINLKNELGIEAEIDNKLYDENELLYKEETLIDLINSIPDNIIVWVNFVETSNILYNKLTSKNIKCDIINGSVQSKKREEILNKFLNNEIKILIAHPLTIGTGVNIFSSIKYMIWYELTYDMALFEQAEGRIKRIGQKNNTFIYYFIGKKTPDKEILFALNNKLNVEKYLFETYLKEE